MNTRRMRRILESLVSLFLVGAVALSGQKQSEPQGSQQLRARAEGYYTALNESRWKKVESFLDEDAKVLWAESKKTAILSYKIVSVEVLPGGKDARTEAMVEYSTAGMGFPARSFKVPQTQEWVWENDDWFAVFRLKPSDVKPVVQPEAADPNATPELTFDPEVYDYRLVRRGELIHAKFSFVNTSNHNVKLRTAVLNLCNCITIKASKSEVKPRERGTIEMTMDSSQLGGVVTQSFVVEMEPSRTKKVLTIEGTVFMAGPKSSQDSAPK